MSQYTEALIIRDYGKIKIFQHCLPNREETRYSASVSAAKFRGCSSKNIGTSPMCKLPHSVTGKEPNPGYIPMWGTSVMDDYRQPILLN